MTDGLAELAPLAYLTVNGIFHIRHTLPIYSSPYTVRHSSYMVIRHASTFISYIL